MTSVGIVVGESSYLMPPVIDANEIARERLIQVVISRAPRLVVVAAPAGYGKSTFVRQLMARVSDSTICDCLAVRDEVDLARALLAALAAARPELADAIAAAELGATNNSSDWTAVALRFWRSPGAGFFVFENAETLVRVPAAMAFLAALIRAAQQPVVVCSRDAVPVPYGHGIDPSNVATFGIDDLRFRPQEVRAALPDLASHEQAVVETISRGWPIVVALLGRAAREKAFADVVADLGTVVHDELLRYLTSELLDKLSERDFRISLILAALPDPTYADIVRGWPTIARVEIDRIAERVPLSCGTDGVIRLHPMLIALFRERRPADVPQIFERAAHGAQASGDEMRAAELHLANGDEFAAGRALRNLGAFIMTSPPPRLAAIISRFAEQTLLAFPALWCSALNHRGYAIPPYEWLRSAQTIWSTLPADAGDEVRASVFSALLNAHTNLGQCARAGELLERYRSTLRPADPYARGVATLWAAALDSFDGRYGRIAEYTQALRPLLDHSDLAHALYLYDVVSTIARTRGEWDRDAAILARARELFERTPLSIGLLGFVESAFASWLAGDDERCDEFVAELERRVTTANERGHRFFVACARGDAERVPYGYENARAQGLLIASARATSYDAARRCASNAVAVADQSERRFLRILARCALAVLDDTCREEMLREAGALAAGLDSDPLRVAVAALRERCPDAGMLASFAARYARRGRRKDAVDIRVLRGEVFADGRLQAPSRSEFAVLIALVQHARPFSVSELGDLLFPDLDADSAGNRIYVYVHRLRARLGRDAVLADTSGYRLGPVVSVDLWRLAALDAKVRANVAFSNADMAELRSLEPVSLAEIEALALRLRLPERLTGMLRAAWACALALRDAVDSDDGCSDGETRKHARHVPSSPTSKIRRRVETADTRHARSAIADA